MEKDIKKSDSIQSRATISDSTPSKEERREKTGWNDLRIEKSYVKISNDIGKNCPRSGQKTEDFMRIRITSDSTCDLSQELLQKYNIAISPLYIVKDGTPYKDALEITPDDIYAHVAQTGHVCTTSAINVDEYVSFFQREGEGYDAIIHFTISSEMSSSFQNATLAGEQVGNVYVIDSRNLSTGIGHLVLDAAILAESGMDAAEIVKVLEEKKEKLDVSFVLDTLKYLSLGGRCSSLVALGANLLNIKPSIQVKNGKMGVGKKYRCSFDRALIRYVQDKLAEPETVDPSRIFITDSGVSEELKEAVERAVLSCVPFQEVHHTRAGCTISNHCGPNCLGILFYRK